MDHSQNLRNSSFLVPLSVTAGVTVLALVATFWFLDRTPTEVVPETHVVEAEPEGAGPEGDTEVTPETELANGEAPAGADTETDQADMGEAAQDAQTAAPESDPTTLAETAGDGATSADATSSEAAVEGETPAEVTAETPVEGTDEMPVEGAAETPAEDTADADPAIGETASATDAAPAAGDQAETAEVDAAPAAEDASAEDASDATVTQNTPVATAGPRVDTTNASTTQAARGPVAWVSDPAEQTTEGVTLTPSGPEGRDDEALTTE